MSGCPGSRRGMSRRRFLMCAGGAALAAGAYPGRLLAAGGREATVAAAEGTQAPGNVKRAIEALGGIRAFVSKGDIVVVKPNIGWDRSPAQAANTDPEVVVAVAELCLLAGAKRVRVFDRSCNEPRRCYASSGIREAVERFAGKSGAGDVLRIEHVEDRKFVRTAIPGAAVLKEWDLYRDALEADAVINVPVAKHHSLAVVTLGLKNMMGVMGGNRGQIHFRLSECLADVHRRIPARLTLIDATRVLLRNGPTGGNLSDVLHAGKVYASADVVAADVVAAKELFGLSPADVPHIAKALESGIGVSGPAAIRRVGA